MNVLKKWLFWYILVTILLFFILEKLIHTDGGIFAFYLTPVFLILSLIFNVTKNIKSKKLFLKDWKFWVWIVLIILFVVWWFWVSQPLIIG